MFARHQYVRAVVPIQLQLPGRTNVVDEVHKLHVPSLVKAHIGLCNFHFHYVLLKVRDSKAVSVGSDAICRQFAINLSGVLATL